MTLQFEEYKQEELETEPEELPIADDKIEL